MMKKPFTPKYPYVYMRRYPQKLTKEFCWEMLKTGNYYALQYIPKSSFDDEMFYYALQYESFALRMLNTYHTPFKPEFCIAAVTKYPLESLSNVFHQGPKIEDSHDLWMELIKASEYSFVWIPKPSEAQKSLHKMLWEV